MPHGRVLTRFTHADDDGEKETRVLEEYIKQTDSSPRGDSRSPRGRRGSRLSEGDAIEARYRGRSKYYKGRIRRDRGDGTYDVDCEHAASLPSQSQRARPSSETETVGSRR